MRTLERIIASTPTWDGDGVSINRIGGRAVNAVLDPFLLIDEIFSDQASDYIGGFPEHPHRGMETITYMKAGRMRHRDHMGNEGVIGAGDVQWMTAGRGVLHSEMPEQDSGLLHGFQLWLNLPANEKMKPAAYHDIAGASIPFVALPEGGSVSVLAGDVVIDRENTLQGALPALSTRPLLLDVTLSADESVALTFNQQDAALAFLYDGSLLDQQTIVRGHLAVYSQGETLQLQAGQAGAKLLVLSGRALKEPIAQHGPFVMNTREEIDQAIADYRSGQLLS